MDCVFKLARCSLSCCATAAACEVRLRVATEELAATASAHSRVLSCSVLVATHELTSSACAHSRLLAATLSIASGFSCSEDPRFACGEDAPADGVKRRTECFIF